MALGSTQPLTEMSTRSISWGQRRSVRKADNLTLEFFIDIKSFQLHYGPGVDSASNRNEYQEHFLGAKAAGA